MLQFHSRRVLVQQFGLMYAMNISFILVLLLFASQIQPKDIVSAENTVLVDENGNIDTISNDVEDTTNYPQTCYSWATTSTCNYEPNLYQMTVQYSNGIYNETFYAYKVPDVSTFYNQTPGSMSIRPSTKFNGMFGKFTNMSPKIVQVYWISGRPNDAPNYIADIEPFGSAGTATYPKHKFIVTLPTNDPISIMKNKKNILVEWVMDKDNSLYYYDPYNNNPVVAQKSLSIHEYQLYYIQIQNRAFAIQYRQFTNGVDYLGLYKHKLPPRYHMWPANAINETHTVVSNEIYFESIPPNDILQRGVSKYGPRPDEITNVRPYRVTPSSITLSLRVLSCSPRAFEIRNFLSDVEVDHVLQIAHTKHMDRSSTKAGDAASERTNDSTRTSRNTWISRNHDIVMDVIYKRLADILQIPESLLRWRHLNEVPEMNNETMISIAERLQLVHYDVGQQYTAHHDFQMPAMVNGQPSRFATVLLYLNDDMEGGETSFPRWMNGHTSEPLLVKPERGKAILFYNLLPDGNYDERSQHAALPVRRGEKYLMNLWVWDPIMDQYVTNLSTTYGRFFRSFFNRTSFANRFFDDYSISHYRILYFIYRNDFSTKHL